MRTASQHITRFGIAASLSVLALITSLQSCGKKSKSSDNVPPVLSAAALVLDSQLTSSVVNAAHGDAVAAAADQGGSGSTFNFALTDSDNDDTTMSRICALSADGKSAVVTISSSINRSRTKTSGNGKVTITGTRTGNGTSTRTWSKTDGVAVACNATSTGAALNFQDPTNLKLDVVFERSRSDSLEISRQGFTRKSSKNFTSKGTRSITWAANSGTETTNYIRSKTVVIKDVNQSMVLTDKNGASFSTGLSINTLEGSPLVINVERKSPTDITPNAVVSKTFVSGAVETRKDSDAVMTTTYNNLKLKFEDRSCSIESGSAQIVIKDSTGAVLKTLTLGRDSSGESTLEDSTGAEVEDFALDPCDSEDTKL